ncbi:carboxymuconolactone decarboxylase family protein [Phyllobacterium sp. 628]|uniref:carboxymuconolactone decarboxylase family protein n=1 Tax=Phyllobacterium sp. 628 TaxID=2718938 RepID=UPI0016627919|nr:carboxymuconolactone decarboxylase family protein [Phyllobacterium sp. 628]QND52490.1 carboxymuconolactone decarboxylase family protein [Phyllobacterium sp. 628]
MKARLNPYNYAATMKPMFAMEETVVKSGLEHSLIELVKMRASQINGCAYCIDMHSKDAIKSGETVQRLVLLDAWQESPLYSDRERAALAWTEVLTLVAETHVPDSDFETLKQHFTEEEIVKLTMLIVTINSWNRISIGFRAIHPVEKASAAA